MGKILLLLAAFISGCTVPAWARKTQSWGSASQIITTVIRTEDGYITYYSDQLPRVLVFQIDQSCGETKFKGVKVIDRSSNKLWALRLFNINMENSGPQWTITFTITEGVEV